MQLMCVGLDELVHLPQLLYSRRPNIAWSESEFEESMPNVHTQTNMHVLARMYICAA